MSVKKKIIFYNQSIFSELRKAIDEHRTIDYESHIKNILTKSRSNVISY